MITIGITNSIDARHFIDLIFYRKRLFASFIFMIYYWQELFLHKISLTF